MTNVINIDFSKPETSFEQMMEEASQRYLKLNPNGPVLVANIGDTDVFSDHSTVFVKVDGETVLCFDRNAGSGLTDLIEALNSQVLSNTK